VSPREQTVLLLHKAAEDEALVDEVIASANVSDQIIGFHCQQAAEKLLKALLSERDIPFRRTHDLREMMDALVDAGCPLPDKLANLDRLTPYATLFRYELPETGVRVDRRETREMIRDLRTWVEGKIGP